VGRVGYSCTCDLDMDKETHRHGHSIGRVRGGHYNAAPAFAGDLLHLIHVSRYLQPQMTIQHGYAGELCTRCVLQQYMLYPAPIPVWRVQPEQLWQSEGKRLDRLCQQVPPTPSLTCMT
jgi:hypothetical protein